MNEIVKLLTNFLNTRIEQSLMDFKKQVSDMKIPEHSVSSEELQRLIDVVNQNVGSGDGSDVVRAMACLGKVDEEWSDITDQVKLIESFLKICDDFCDYTGFFVFKNGNAHCYDATDHPKFPQKGLNVAAPRFNKVTSIEESVLPENVKALFEGIDDTHVLPLKLKFKTAGFVLTVLSDPGMLSFMNTMVSLLSRELTLLPYKVKAQKDEPVTTNLPESIPVAKEPSRTPSISSVASESPMDKAMRYAKLLTSEIKLYNEKLVNQGLESGGMRELLQADIERSYNTFRERFPNRDEIPDRIFEEALIQYVANGNADLL